ncbi:MAG: hypothetical protein ABIK83_10620 [Candidatus Zixiibacteriota bacterium]
MMIRFKALLLVSAILAATFVDAVATDNLSISGYAKNFSTILDFPAFTGPGFRPDEPLLGSVSNRLRMKARWRISEKFALNAEYDLSGKVQDKRLFTSAITIAQINPFSYRAIDLEERVYPRNIDDAESFVLSQNLDRLFVTIKTSQFDVFVGRQAIAWGSARAVNPTDVIAPYTYNELDTEDRVGVDAIRLRYPLGFMGEIDAGYVFGDDFKFDQSAFFARGKFYAGHTDVSIMMVGFRENLMAGFDIARSIGGAGFWAEGAYVFANALGDSGIISGESYFRGSAGLDYSFASGLYGFIEYHFNQAGTTDQDKYIGKFSTTAYTDGAVYLLGCHYLSPGFAYQLTPLVTLSGQALINATDPSVLVAPSIEYNISNNIYIAAGAFTGLGRGPKLRVSESHPDISVSIDSEFGSYPDIYYMSFRIYF